MRDKIESGYRSIENLFWIFEWNVKTAVNRDLKGTLRRNAVLRNTHLGESCFILGNGPSLKLENRLSELSDKFTITVNQMYRSEIFKIVNPNMHFIMDPLFFSLKADEDSEKETLSLIKDMRRTTNIPMVLPYIYLKKAGELGIAKNNDFYIYPRESCYGTARDINITRYTPRIQNVVQAAIYVALYMGFSKIVLLGVDMTGLLDVYVKRIPDKVEQYSHVYDYSENEKIRMKTIHDMQNNTTTLEQFANTFKIFQWLNEYAKKHHVKIVNASRTTALDVYDYTTIDNELDGVEKQYEM